MDSKEQQTLNKDSDFLNALELTKVKAKISLVETQINITKQQIDQLTSFIMEKDAKLSATIFLNSSTELVSLKNSDKTRQHLFNFEPILSLINKNKSSLIAINNMDHEKTVDLMREVEDLENEVTTLEAEVVKNNETIAKHLQTLY